jgi:hypothetical protein
MPIVPALALLALVILLGLLAACHFFQGRRHKDHASRRGTRGIASATDRKRQIRQDGQRQEVLCRSRGANRTGFRVAEGRNR